MRHGVVHHVTGERHGPTPLKIAHLICEAILATHRLHFVRARIITVVLLTCVSHLNGTGYLRDADVDGDRSAPASRYQDIEAQRSMMLHIGLHQNVMRVAVVAYALHRLQDVLTMHCHKQHLRHNACQRVAHHYIGHNRTRQLRCTLVQIPLLNAGTAW